MTQPPAPAPLISTDDLRLHVETGLPDAALEQVIAQMDALIVERHGPHDGPLTETVYPYSTRGTSGYPGDSIGYAYGHHDYAYGDAGYFWADISSHVRVNRPIASITSITAYDSYRADATATVIPADEYRVEGRLLVRLMRRYSPRVVIVYMPVDNRPARQRVLVQLVRSELRWAPVMAEGVDGASVTYRAYGLDQRAILESLRESLV